MLFLLIGCFQIDGEEWTDWTGDATSNALPQVEDVIISSEEAIYNDVVLTCSATASDPDGEVQIAYSWEKNNEQIASEETIDLASQDVQPEDVITCIASAVDSEGAEASDSASITIENRSPGITTLSLTEENPEANEIVECLVTSSDPDGDELSVDYLWEQEENLLGTDPSLDLSSISVEVGATISCTVSIDDGHGGADSDVVSLTIENTPPEISDAVISPNPANTGSLLSCSASGIDLNDGELEPSYLWTNGERELGNEETLQLNSGLALPGDTVQCTASVTDIEGLTASSSDSLVIGNGAPVFTVSASISPNVGVFVGVQVDCLAEVEDPEDGVINPFFSWTVNGTEVATGASYTVLAEDTNMNDVLGCTAIATDSQGVEQTSNTSVVIENTPPIVTTVTISPNPPYNDDAVTCSAVVVDPDETLIPSYTWSSNSTVFGATDTINLADWSLSPHDPLSCTVDVEDLHGETAQNSTIVIIGNRPPSAPQISISWSSTGNNPDASDTNDLTCAASGSVDPDGSAVSYSYLWTSNAGGSISGTTLSAGDTSVGETWTCTVTTTDGIANTTGTDSALITPAISWDYCASSQTLGDTSYQFTGENAEDYAARSVANIGDIDGDGLDDVLIGAAGHDSGGLTDTGKAYLFLGASLSNSANFDPSQADYVFTGEASGDEFGHKVASAGDVDGDGLEDILISAPSHDSQGYNNRGKIYLFFASSLGSSGTIPASFANYSFIGESADDYAGGAISSAGDIDGDNLDELLFGVSSYDHGNYTSAGRAYLILGSSLGSNTAMSLDSADYFFYGQSAYEFTGSSVASAGDVNGDGFDDILIGQSGYDDGASWPTEKGRVALFSGASFGAYISTFYLSSAEHTFVGELDYSFAGVSVASVGDIDGDDKDDILIGAYAYGSYVGAGYLMLSSSLGSSSEISLSNADYRFIGESADDYAGYSVSSAGDIDSDGVPDILIGAYGYNNERGKGYLFLGASLNNSTLNLLDADYSFTGENLGDRASVGLAGGGDITGDGVDDILVGADKNDDSGAEAGKLSLFIGCE